MKLRYYLLIALILLLFLMALTQMERGYEDQGKQQLEEVLRRTAVTCYASEGFYPPDVAYMRNHYGLRFDEENYLVRYTLFASNLMPDITVLEVAP